MSDLRPVQYVALMMVIVGCGDAAPSNPEPGPDAGPLPPAAVLVIDQSRFDFGAFSVGSATDAHRFTIANTGSAIASINVALVGADSDSFAMVSTTCLDVLEAGASCTADVALVAQREGAVVAGVEAHAKGTTALAPLTGAGVAATLVIEPSVGQFEVVQLAESATRTLTVRNGSASPLPTPVIQFPSDTAYELVTSDCTGALPVGATCAFTVRFRPSTVGTQLAAVGVTAGVATARAQLAGLAFSPITVVSTGPGTLTGAGFDCGADCASATISSPLVVTAVPAPGAALVSWSGGATACGTATTCSVPVTSGTTAIAATFAAKP